MPLKIDYIDPSRTEIKQYTGRHIPANPNIVIRPINPSPSETQEPEVFLFSGHPIYSDSPSEDVDTNIAANAYNPKRGGIHFIDSTSTISSLKTGGNNSFGGCPDRPHGCEETPNLPPVIQNSGLPSKDIDSADVKTFVIDDSFGCQTITLLNNIMSQINLSIDIDCFVNNNQNGAPDPPTKIPFIDTICNKLNLTEAECAGLKNKYKKQFKAQWNILTAALENSTISIPVTCPSSGCIQLADGSGSQCNDANCAVSVGLQAIVFNNDPKNPNKIDDILKLLCDGLTISLILNFEILNDIIIDPIIIDDNGIPVIPSLPFKPGTPKKPTPGNHAVTLIGYECANDGGIYLIFQDSYLNADGTIRKFKIKLEKKDFNRGIPKWLKDNIGTPKSYNNTMVRIVGIKVTSGPTPANPCASDCAKNPCPPASGCSGTCTFEWGPPEGGTPFDPYQWNVISDGCTGTGPLGVLCQCSEPAEEGSYQGQQITTSCT